MIIREIRTVFYKHNTIVERLKCGVHLCSRLPQDNQSTISRLTLDGSNREERKMSESFNDKPWPKQWCQWHIARRERISSWSISDNEHHFITAIICLKFDVKKKKKKTRPLTSDPFYLKYSPSNIIISRITKMEEEEEEEEDPNKMREKGGGKCKFTRMIKIE